VGDDQTNPSEPSEIAAVTEHNTDARPAREAGAHAPDPVDDTMLVAGPQPEAAVTAQEAGPSTSRELDDRQRQLLTGVLNHLVPARDQLAGAGDIGVVDSIERTLATAVALRRLFFDGLLHIELTAVASTNSSFNDLDAAGQEGVLVAVERTQPAFFAALVNHTYRGYYGLRAVHDRIGFESRPPQPLGHQLPMFDPAVLEVQRRREPFWRRTT